MNSVIDIINNIITNRLIIFRMSHRGRGNSSNRGRGGRTIAQMENQRLIAENIANITSSSSSNTPKSDELLFKEFMEFKARVGNTSQSNPSYANNGIRAMVSRS